MRSQNSSRYRYSSLEIGVTIVLFALSSILVGAAFTFSQKSARDSERIGSLREVQASLELYYKKYGAYPEGDNLGANGWDTPGNGTFISPLVEAGFMSSYAHDPVADSVTGNFRYQRFPAGAYGCPVAHGNFYILGVENMEWDFRARMLSPGWNCAEKHFGDEMEFVVGKFEN